MIPSSKWWKWWHPKCELNGENGLCLSLSSIKPPSLTLALLLYLYTVKRQMLIGDHNNNHLINSTVAWSPDCGGALRSHGWQFWRLTSLSCHMSLCQAQLRSETRRLRESLTKSRRWQILCLNNRTNYMQHRFKFKAKNKYKSITKNCSVLISEFWNKFCIQTAIGSRKRIVIAGILCILRIELGSSTLARSCM